MNNLSTLLFTKWRFMEHWLYSSHSSIATNKQSWFLPGNFEGPKSKRANCADRAFIAHSIKTTVGINGALKVNIGITDTWTEVNNMTEEQAVDPGRAGHHEKC